MYKKNVLFYVFTILISTNSLIHSSEVKNYLEADENTRYNALISNIIEIQDLDRVINETTLNIKSLEQTLQKLQQTPANPEFLTFITKFKNYFENFLQHITAIQAYNLETHQKRGLSIAPHAPAYFNHSQQKKDELKSRLLYNPNNELDELKDLFNTKFNPYQKKFITKYLEQRTSSIITFKKSK